LFHVYRTLVFWFSCGRETEPEPYKKWQETAAESGVILDVPTDATVHDFGTAVLVFLRPVFKPVLSDWQYAAEIKAERLSRAEFNARLKAARVGPESRWISLEHQNIDVLRDGDVTFYRLDKPCNATDLVTCTAYYNHSRGHLSTDATATDDEVIRRILQSARCGHSSAH